MLNVYENIEKTKRKTYVAVNIKHGTTKNNVPYTTFSISDSKRLPSGQWVNDYYNVYVWKCLNIDEKDEIVLSDIIAFDIRVVGTKVYKTIFADVEVTSKTQPTELPNIDWDTDSPF